MGLSSIFPRFGVRFAFRLPEASRYGWLPLGRAHQSLLHDRPRLLSID